ncbi:hypothetical protein HK100_008196 [Physocladia obscura]|uniref:Dirigent protein n=1 Tax=Physocladia obscura TaxID=109957 RepID=A0AAD5T704_9FUNG|nr:hypothetical protein HK100_008196 [Physocladia obscura]
MPSLTSKLCTLRLVSLLTFLFKICAVRADINVSDAPQLDTCSKTSYPSVYTPGKTTAPIVQVAFSQTINNANPLYCSGTFLFVDGCTFTIKNFTFLNAYQSQWYGGVVGLVDGKIEVNQNAVTMVSGYVSAVNMMDQTYSLSTTAGAAYS